MTSKVITYDFLQQIINNNTELNKKFDKLYLDNQRTSLSFKDFRLDNENPFNLCILPEGKEKSHGLKLGTNSSKLSTISFNDNVLIKNGSIYLKQNSLDSTNFKPINILQTKRILDIIQTIDIELNDDDSLGIYDNYYFFSESTNQEIYINQNKLLLSLVVFAKDTHKRLTMQEAISNSQSSELDISNLTDQLNNVVQEIDRVTKKNSLDISVIKSTLKTVNVTLNDFESTTMNIIEEAETKFNKIQGEIKGDLLKFHEDFEKFKEFQNLVSSDLEKVNDENLILKQSFENDHELLCKGENKCRELDETLNKIVEKQTLMNNSLISHGSRIGVLSNLEKIIDNKLAVMNNNISDIKLDVSQKVDDTAELYDKRLDESKKNIETHYDFLDNISKKMDKTSKEVYERSDNLSSEFKKLDEYVKNCMISVNNRAKEVTDSFNKADVENVKKINLHNESVQNTKYELQGIKANISKFDVLEQKLEQIVMGNQKYASQIVLLNNEIDSKNRKIDELHILISKLTGQFGEFKRQFENERVFRSDIQINNMLNPYSHRVKSRGDTDMPRSRNQKLAKAAESNVEDIPSKSLELVNENKSTLNQSQPKIKSSVVPTFTAPTNNQTTTTTKTQGNIGKIKIPESFSGSESDNTKEKKRVEPPLGVGNVSNKVSDTIENETDPIPHPVAPGFTTSTPTKTEIETFTSGSDSESSIRRKNVVKKI